MRLQVVEPLAGVRARRLGGPSLCPARRARIPAKIEDRIVYLRRSRRWGPDRIAAYMGQSSSTVHRVLVRRGLNRLDRLDRQTGRRLTAPGRANPPPTDARSARPSRPAR